MMKRIALYVLLLLLSACSQKERHRNVSNLVSVNIGDDLNEVVYKMKSSPDKIIFSDSMYYKRKKVNDLITFVYFTPRGASSNIHIYFKEHEVFYIYADY